jgi:hypothetical protein
LPAPIVKNFAEDEGILTKSMRNKNNSFKSLKTQHLTKPAPITLYKYNTDVLSYGVVKVSSILFPITLEVGRCYCVSHVSDLLGDLLPYS